MKRRAALQLPAADIALPREVPLGVHERGLARRTVAFLAH
jgi:hypothetical protein